MFTVLCVMAGIVSAAAGVSVINYARKEGVGLWPMSVLGGGFFLFAGVIFLNVAGIFK